MRKLRVVLVIVVAVVLALLIAVPQRSQALFENAKQAACSGIALQEGSTACPDSGSAVDGIVKLVINILSVVVSIAAVIMIIIGGLKYVTSQGESSNTAGAKNTIIYALIGLVIVALAQVIVRLTLNRSAQATCAPGTSIQAGTCK